MPWCDMIQTGVHRQWLATRNLWNGRTEHLPDEVVIYCLTLMARRPHEVPSEVVAYLAERLPYLWGTGVIEEV